MWSLSVLMLVVVMMKEVSQAASSSSQPSVTVGETTVFGSTVQVGDTTVSQYLGVRYAQPPVGSRRFRRPVAAVPVSGEEVNATTYPRTCPGIMSILPMDEDCLFLNLYVPKSREQGGEGTRLPVMVWIYGGGFLFGAGSQYDGGLLAAEGNVIVVTLNYRVGALGFLSTGDNSSVGNYGLWDQWLALKWVKNNVGHFGGDVNRITLFGESAGAASVSYHMTSPHSQGLFHSAILHSGCRLNPWAMDREGLKHAQSLAPMLSCGDIGTTSDLVTCLRGKPWNATITPLWLGGPVVDNDFVLPLDKAPVFDGPFIVGVNNREGGMLLQAYRRFLPVDFTKRANYHGLLKESLGQMYPSLAAAASQTAETLAVKVLDCVYREEGSTESHVTEEELEAVTGDVQIVLGSQQFLDVENATDKRYLYYFDHYPDNIEEGQKGMDHAMELDYTFGFLRGIRAPHSPFHGHNVSERDQLLGRRFRSLLANFAHSGDPSPPAERLPAAWPQWPPYVKGSQSYLSLTFSPRVASRLNQDLRKVWMETIPGVLDSRGVLGLNDTRWASCAEVTSRSPALSASVILVMAASLWTASVWM